MLCMSKPILSDLMVSSTAFTKHSEFTDLRFSNPTKEPISHSAILAKEKGLDASFYEVEVIRDKCKCKKPWSVRPFSDLGLVQDNGPEPANSIVLSFRHLLMVITPFRPSFKNSTPSFRDSKAGIVDSLSKWSVPCQPCLSFTRGEPASSISSHHAGP